jgi:hypothetical protein
MSTFPSTALFLALLPTRVDAQVATISAGTVANNAVVVGCSTRLVPVLAITGAEMHFPNFFDDDTPHKRKISLTTK